MRIKQFTVKGYPNVKDTPSLILGHNGLLICDEKNGEETSIIEVICDALSDQYAPDADNSQEDDPQRVNVEIILTDHDSEWVIGTANTNPVDNDVKKLKDVFIRENFTLKAGTLKNFTKLTPENRYLAIAEMVSLNVYCYFETMFEVISAPLIRKQVFINNEINEIKSQLSRLFSIRNIDGEDTCICEINLRLAQAQMPAISSLDQLKDTLTQIDAAIANWMISDKFINITNLQSAVKDLTCGNEIWNLWTAYSTAWDKLHTLELETKGLFFDDILSKGLEWIVTERLENCPLCQSKIDIDALKIDIDHRLSNNKTLSILRSEFASAAQPLFAMFSPFMNKLANISNGCRKLNIDNPLSQITAELEKYQSFINTNNSSIFIPVFENVTYQDYIEAVASLNNIIDDFSQKHLKNDSLEVLKEIRLILKKTDSLTNELKRLQDSVDILESQRSSHRKLIDLAAKAKKIAIEKFIAGIAAKADGYFRDIYSPEKDKKHKNSTVFNPQTGVTLDSIKCFDGTSLPEYYNQDRISTLGLCIFLAIRRSMQSTPNNVPLMFIDKALDITDADKKEQIIELIFREFGDYQLIIATSDLDWMKCMAEAKNKANKKMSVKFDSLNLYSKYRQSI